MHLCDLNLLNQTYFLVWCLRIVLSFVFMACLMEKVFP